MQPKRGFSLIEVLAVLAIVSILCSVAYPSYAMHIVRARRVEGMIALMEAMQRQQAIFLRTNQYVEFSSGGGADPAPDVNGFKWWSGANPVASAYELHARACTDAGADVGAGGAALAQCVEIVASPGTALVDGRFRDPECGALTLVSTGERRSGGTAKGCWP